MLLAHCGNALSYQQRLVAIYEHAMLCNFMCETTLQPSVGKHMKLGLTPLIRGPPDYRIAVELNFYERK